MSPIRCGQKFIEWIQPLVKTVQKWYEQYCDIFLQSFTGSAAHHERPFVMKVLPSALGAPLVLNILPFLGTMCAALLVSKQACTTSIGFSFAGTSFRRYIQGGPKRMETCFLCHIKAGEWICVILRKQLLCFVEISLT